MQPEEFLDWVVAVEEILDFKGAAIEANKSAARQIKDH
jgi:hypothetical protein